ncbi:SDR family oxidoreductase [Pseudomonas brassicacearum]|uniref:SDR family NAD(P)-dependent oxidoreductase n=1 Tax=Pseudomonas brassicacearum TaxID=930166 RepID=UPI000F4AA7A7|nr:SDR family NAD(P)-dependent oxidoreductase [Pseudomonas brassicacearum]ROM69756.1 SDR family oxidoreductase [Pseudomonas brassicacearum]
MMSKVVLVTGALTGIGRAACLAFARNGASIVATGRRVDAGESLCNELLKAGAADADFVNVDVRFENDVLTAAQFVDAKYGRLDVAVNNAGIEGTFTDSDQITTEIYREVFDTNVLGLALSMKHELIAMKRQRFGSIVNLSSIGGSVGFPGSAIYAASKHAVEGLSKSAALEVAGMGIRVNCVAPGPTNTPMLHRLAEIGLTEEALSGLIPAKRLGTAEEVAQTILFLASDAASFVTGQSLAVDGGYLAQ